MLKNQFLLLFLCFVSMDCRQEIADVSGKCEREKIKNRQCLVASVLICEKTPDAERYRQRGINICTNIDGYFFPINVLCAKSYECQP